MIKVIFLALISFIGLNFEGSQKAQDLNVYAAKKQTTKKQASSKNNNKNTSKNNSKNTPKPGAKASCAKPQANLAVVNFSATKVVVYVNQKKAGTVPAMDQKLIKEILPVGTVNVQITTGTKQVLAEGEYTIKAEGKKTCKNTQSIVYRTE